MSTSNLETQPEVASVKEAVQESKPERKKKQKSLVDDFLQLLSSVKFGIFLLVVLMLFSMVGTFVVQQGTSDFDKFFNSLTPSEVKLYEMLGFFDIYHSWYFNFLLLTLSLNIILASIDRAPGYWHFFTQPKTSASESYMRHQQYHTRFKLPTSVNAADLVKNLDGQCRNLLLPKWAKIFGPLGPMLARLTLYRNKVSTGADGSTTVFVERSVWNRLAFCAVHVALLMILIGWFVGNKWGQKGVVSLAPGEASATFVSQGPNNTVNSFKMPFRLMCYDIEQDLMDSKKPDLSPSNTLDWFTRVVFEDKDKKLFKGTVHLNNPLDFRGYRFFQASFDQINSAREIVLLLSPKDGQGQAQEVLIKRNGSTDVPGVGTFNWQDFYPDFRFDQKSGRPATASGDYNFPVADVQVKLADGTTKSVLAFTDQMMDSVKQAPFLADKLVVGNFNISLKDYEKVSRAHTLQIQYDPGVNTIYLGCAGLVFILISVFFFAHERVWVFVKPNQNELTLYFAGNTNRNRPAFEARYNQLINQFRQSVKEAEEVKEAKPKAAKEEKAEA